MTTGDTIFKFNGGYILLEDLEDWYENGFVTPRDTIQIFKNERSASYEVGTLINIYGQNYPFRRLLQREFEFDPLTAGLSSSDSEEEVAPHNYHTKQVSSTENSQIDLKKPQAEVSSFVNYPLLNNQNETKEDIITGQDVIEYMKRLGFLMPLTSWTHEDEAHFSFIFKTGEQVICRFCNKMPADALRLLQHLFSKDHINKLSKCKMAKSSFIYWKNHFEDLRLEKKRNPFSRFPLFYPYSGVNEKHLSPMEINVLVRMISESNPDNFSKPLGCLAQFFQSVDLPEYCEICKYSTPKSYLKYTKHILSEGHLNRLTTVCQEEVNFWMNILSLKNVNAPNVIRILSLRNSPSIPLIDFYIESELVDVQLRSSMIEELRKLFQNAKKENWLKKGNLIPPPNNGVVTCVACVESAGIFPVKEYELIEHIFSSEHVNHLIQFGFSENAVSWWKQRFLLFGSEQDTPREVSEVKQPPCLATPIGTPSKTSGLGNNPRVPLLDLPPEKSVMVIKEIFIKSFQEMKTSGSYIKDKNAKVVWKCEYCGIISKPVKLSTEKSAFDHIISEKHKQAMKFTASEDDIKFWKNWAKRTGSEAITKARTTQNKKEHDKLTFPNPQTSFAVEERNSKNSANNPRVPMLDKAPQGETIKKKEFHKALEEVCKLKKTGGRNLRNKLRSMTTNYKCSFCEDPPGSQLILKNMHEVIQHFIQSTHRQNMHCSASSEDIKFWKNLLISNSAQVAANRTERRRTKNSKNHTIGPNVERVAMLDEMLANEKSVSRELFNNILDEGSELYKKYVCFSNEATKKLLWKCTFCSDKSKTCILSSKGTAFAHIASQKHRTNMKFQASMSDLQFWKDWIENVVKIQKSKSTASGTGNNQLQSTKATPSSPQCSNLSVVPQLGTVSGAGNRQLQSTEATPSSPQCSNLSVVPQLGYTNVPRKENNCSLPLFAMTPSGIFTITHLGPTNLEIEFIEWAKRVGYSIPMFNEPTLCGCCNEELTHLSLVQVADHAFSVNHMKRRTSLSLKNDRNDYSWWMKTLQYLLKVEDYHSVSHRISEYCLGYSNHLVHLACSTDVFHFFTSEERELISNFDKTRISPSDTAELLSKYGACTHCNTWNLTLADVVHHFTSESHISTVRCRRIHPVTKLEMSEILKFIADGQKQKPRSFLSECTLL